MKLALVIGTRPEAIKMAPIVLELRKRNIKHIVIATTQHREMLEQSLSLFGITCDYDLDIMKQDQDMFYVTTSVLNAIKPILQNEKPDLLLVQGDTTSAFAASLAAFYLGIPVGHVEAGLRTGNLNNPFPEELNRQMISRIATVHLAPTEWAKQNLLNEGTNAENIYVTGNTVIDALLTVLQNDVVFDNEQLRSIDFEKNKIILLTAHRRENFGEPMRRIFQACRILVETNSDIEIIYPVHLNPNVRGIAREVLENVPRIHLIEPMGYVQFIHLMKRSYLILTDSGGVQEEAPSLGKPVLVLRTTTERPEAIRAGTAKLVGTDTDKIISETQHLLNDSSAYRTMATIANPYGDGKAAHRIVDIILERCN